MDRHPAVQGARVEEAIPDIVVFVNGLPLAVIECKSPTIGDAWKGEAVKQLRRYQEADTTWKDQGAPKLFEAAQILVGTCGERAVYGTVGTPARFFLEWKQPYPLNVEQLGEKLGCKPTPQDILLYGLLEPRNLLDIVRNLVVFEVDVGRTVRKLTRYKQFIAVNEALRRIRKARKPSERGGIVWHTQGSGKSLTMLWLALKLRRDEAQQQPTVVIVTDRTKLDRQIAGVFTACGFPNPERADSVRDLRRILEHPTGKTVQLFSQEFDEKVEALATDDAKASEMEHAIRHEINVRVEENPVFYQSLRERLEEIIEQRRQERLDAAEQLKLLNDLREDLKGEQSQAEKMELDARGFAIYGLLEKQRPRKVKDRTVTYDAANRDLASLIDEAVTPFTDLVDWHQKDDAQREMRREIKRRLRAGGIEDDAVESLAADIVDLAKVRTH